MIKLYIAGASGILGFEVFKLSRKRGIPTKALIPPSAKLNYFRNTIYLDMAAPPCRKISLEAFLNQLDFKTLP